MAKILETVNGFVWGAPALLLILGVGLYLTVRLGFAQFTLLPRAVKALFSAKSKGADGVSAYQALCTALAATVGTGNLVGVAGAICLGGPGAIFWMWICGFLGMATKYAEAVLAVQYRVKDGDGYLGGPMYVMVKGLGKGFYPMAAAYCLCGMLAAFGVGTGTQINAVITGLHGVQARFGLTSTKTGDMLIGIAMGIGLCTLLLGGASAVGKAAERLIPFAACGYLALCVGVLLVRYERIGEAFWMILQGAAAPRAVTGGMLGSAFTALRIGCSRGVFTNEAGMGTAAMAHGSAKVSHPAQQGLMGILEVFLDTIVICTMTALVILVSGVPIPYGLDVGAELTAASFSCIYGPNAVIWLTAAMLLFAVATVLGWGYYGARCAEFLFGKRAWKWFAVAQAATAAISATLDTVTVWQLSETLNGLMAIPNLITLAILTPVVCGLTKAFRKSDKGVLL